MFNAAAKPRKKETGPVSVRWVWVGKLQASATCNQNSSSERLKCLYRNEAAWAVDA
ncbi:hypothetical protein V8C44DRAFT_313765 [Trichoderma aethiopicum]